MKIYNTKAIDGKVFKTTKDNRNINITVTHSGGLLVESYENPKGDYPYQEYDSFVEFHKNDNLQLSKEISYISPSQVGEIVYYHDPVCFIKIDTLGDGTIDQCFPREEVKKNQERFQQENAEIITEENHIDENTKTITKFKNTNKGKVYISSDTYVYDSDGNLVSRTLDLDNNGSIESIVQYGDYQCF